MTGRDNWQKFPGEFPAGLVTLGAFGLRYLWRCIAGEKIIIRVHSQEVYVLRFTAGLPVVYQSAGTLWNRWSGLSGGEKRKAVQDPTRMFVDEQHILSVSGVGSLYFFQTSRCKLSVPSESPADLTVTLRVCARFA